MSAVRLKAWYKHGDQQGDNGDNHQQLNQRKSASFPGAGARRFVLSLVVSHGRPRDCTPRRSLVAMDANACPEGIVQPVLVYHPRVL